MIWYIYLFWKLCYYSWVTYKEETFIKLTVMEINKHSTSIFWTLMRTLFNLSRSGKWHHKGLCKRY